MVLYDQSSHHRNCEQEQKEPKRIWNEKKRLDKKKQNNNNDGANNNNNKRRDRRWEKSKHSAWRRVNVIGFRINGFGQKSQKATTKMTENKRNEHDTFLAALHCEKMGKTQQKNLSLIPCCEHIHFVWVSFCAFDGQKMKTTGHTKTKCHLLKCLYFAHVHYSQMVHVCCIAAIVIFLAFDPRNGNNNYSATPTETSTAKKSINGFSSTHSRCVAKC